MRTLGNDTAVDLHSDSFAGHLERLEHLHYGRTIGKGVGLTVNRNFQHPGKQRAAACARSSFETFLKDETVTGRVAQERPGEKPIAACCRKRKPFENPTGNGGGLFLI